MPSCEILIAGLGPAGLGVLTWLESIGALETILATTGKGIDHSVVVVDPRPSAALGAGGLGYLTMSNTTSSMFVRNLTQPQTVDPPPKPSISLASPTAPVPHTEMGSADKAEREASDHASAGSASSPTMKINAMPLPTQSVPRTPKLLPSVLLHALRATPEAKALSGNYFIRLSRVSPWFKRVWREIEAKRFEGSRGKVLSGRYVHKVVTRKDGRYDVHLQGCCNKSRASYAQETVVMTTTKLILATGGKAREAPKWLLDFSKKKKKKLVLSSEETLRSEGFTKVFAHLRRFCSGRTVQRRRSGEARVVVLGGAHSALSVIHTLLSGSDDLIHSDGSLLPRRSGAYGSGKELCAKDVDEEERQQQQQEKVSKNVEKRTFKISENDSTKPETKAATSVGAVNGKEEQKKTLEAPSALVSSVISKISKTQQSSSPSRLAMYPFMKDEIIMLHKREVHMFWANADEARKAGMTVGAKRISQGGKINTYTGLRGPSKALWRKIKHGGEPRVRAFLYPDEEKMRKKVDMCNPDVIVYATGYGFNLPEFQNHEGKPLEIEVDYRGALNTTKQGQLAARIAHVGNSGGSSDGNSGDSEMAFSPLNNVVATGLGAGLRTTHSAIGGEKRLKNVRADGTNLYACQQARVVCREIWGAQWLHILANKAQNVRAANNFSGMHGAPLPDAVAGAMAGSLNEDNRSTRALTSSTTPVAPRSRCTSPNLPIAMNCSDDSDSDTTTDSENSLVFSADGRDSGGGSSGSTIAIKLVVGAMEGKRRILGGSKPSLTTLRFYKRPGQVV